jgi:hypothetical protein
MTVMVMNKETNEEIIYNGVIGYDTNGAIYNGEKPEPVFQLIFTDGGTATFHKSEWYLFVLKAVR